jgi:hypothetical protein
VKWGHSWTRGRVGAWAARRLAQTGLHELDPGLTDSELARIDREYGFEFADDHRAFLAAGLAVILVRGTRYEGWGERPAEGTTGLDTAGRHLAGATVLVPVPVYAHRATASQDLA